MSLFKSILLVLQCEQVLKFKGDGTFGDPAICDRCGIKVARSGDIHRHMLSHLSAEEKVVRQVPLQIYLSLAVPDHCYFVGLTRALTLIAGIRVCRGEMWPRIFVLYSKLLHHYIF